MTTSLVLQCTLCRHAHALSYDVSLRGLGRPASNSTADPAYERYRALTSEVLLSLLPRPLQTAETLGLSGFEWAVGGSSTAIHGNAAFWRGQAGSPVLQASAAPAQLWTPVMHLRKGLPLSTEIGIFGSFLGRSHLVIAGGEFKVALHEGFTPWMPSVAARVAVHRLLGATDFTALAGEGGALMSLPIAWPKVGRITPFVGYSGFLAQVNAQTLDETPFAVTDPIRDQVGGPSGSLYSFTPIIWGQHFMWRAQAGARLQVGFMTVLYALDVAGYAHAAGPLWGQSFNLAFAG